MMLRAAVTLVPLSHDDIDKRPSNVEPGRALSDLLVLRTARLQGDGESPMESFVSGLRACIISSEGCIKPGSMGCYVRRSWVQCTTLALLIISCHIYVLVSDSSCQMGPNNQTVWW